MAFYQVYSSPRKSFLSLFSMNLKLIFLNVALFFLFWIFLYFNILSIDSIAIKPENIFAGKYLWTFLTSMFMHSGFFHLFANMLSLLFIGGLIEKLLGSKRYFWFYLISGLFAGLFFVIVSYLFTLVGQVVIGSSVIDLTLDFSTYAVGASGALFGLVGLLMIMTPNLPVYVMFIPIPIKMKYAAPGILIVLWLISTTTGVRIGNTAHLGGLILGLIYGIYLRYKYPQKLRLISNHFC